MNKVNLFSHLSPHFGLLSVTSMGLLISPILTLNALASIEIAIDPYNDSGLNNTPVMTPFSPIQNNTNSPVTNSQQLPPANTQPLPSGNQNNIIGEVFINGNPTPSRPQVVSGNVIKSNQTLPQIPPLSEPYRAPNNTVNETIEGNNSVLSVSSLSPFDQPPTNNSVEKQPITNSNAVRSIDVSPSNLTSSPPPQVSPTPSVSKTSSITAPSNSERRRALNDILVLSNPTGNPSNATSNPSPTVASSSSTTQELYKVLVGVNNASQESQVKYLYPEAFRTVFNGQNMLQVGVFSSMNTADNVARTLQNKGLKTEITR